MTTWIQCFWDEEAIWFYFEVDAGGWVTRQVELQGSELSPIAAVSLDEWQRASRQGSCHQPRSIGWPSMATVTRYRLVM
ncbi:hypothetical protein AB0L67_28800 [Streptomyces flaveolus]|uniref:hypothetical protein n=1 Tax=Streptomyces flaveolus TaxID=67297 RepID=UPI0034378B9D